MNNEFGFKELYEVSLKSTLPIEVGGNIIEVGETIALFDSIQIANFQEIKEMRSANGGFDNRSHIFWESTKEIKINFTQGIFSKTQFALMTNTKLIESNGDDIVVLGKRETCESDENGIVTIAHTMREPVFVYDLATGKKLTDWTRTDNTISLGQPYKGVVVDYQYDYYNGYSLLKVGQSLTRGYFSLIGKMRVKDDVTGKVRTGIIKIPKLKLMSDLSMRVGSEAIPQVGRLDAVAVPEGVRGQQKVMEIIFLNDDIDADM